MNRNRNQLRYKKQQLFQGPFHNTWRNISKMFKEASRSEHVFLCVPQQSPLSKRKQRLFRVAYCGTQTGVIELKRTMFFVVANINKSMTYLNDRKSRRGFEPSCLQKMINEPITNRFKVRRNNRPGETHDYSLIKSAWASEI